MQQPSASAITCTKSSRDTCCLAPSCKYQSWVLRRVMCLRREHATLLIFFLLHLYHICRFRSTVIYVGYFCTSSSIFIMHFYLWINWAILKIMCHLEMKIVNSLMKKTKITVVHVKTHVRSFRFLWWIISFYIPVYLPFYILCCRLYVFFYSLHILCMYIVPSPLSLSLVCVVL